MNIIDFEEPEIKEELNKPFILEGESSLCNRLPNPRRFEELLYSICRVKIQRSGFDGFDSVSLMSGVRDKGRDCTLFKNGKACGTIQCKKYSSNYSKEEFGLEITKFALYSLLDEKLIFNVEGFTYYIAVSSGFTHDCSELIDDFTNGILNEPNLNRWIDKNLEAPTLASLKLRSPREEILKILSSISVKKILPQDIDLYLNENECSHLIPLFFGVKTAIDNTKIDALIKQLSGEIDRKDIEKQLVRGSMGLSSEENQFEGIPNSHVLRGETDMLLEWVLSDLKRDTHEKPLNICLLSGQAGYGKTTILKDLYNRITENNIPVLGLKADKLYSYTVSDLQSVIGLSIPFYDFFEACEKHFPLTVVLIDQIDALSQSMSSDRRYLNVYRSIIDNLSKKENVRIVISIRPSDLYYDPSLRIYKDVKAVTVNPLSEDIVLEQLAKIGIRREDISAKLLELLGTPSHLNVFSRIASSSKKPFQAATLLNLYLELWKLKVLNISKNIAVDPANIKSLLYLIARKMFHYQRITLSEYQFEEFSTELNYLLSERLIKKEDRQIQFFHQSFYDFIFSKQFVETEGDLIKYILESEQSIHVRSAVRMILGYHRDFNIELYLNTIRNILWNDQIFYHIKHIAFTTILSQESPENQEIEIALEAFKYDIHFANLFFEQARAEIWLSLSIEYSLLDILKHTDSSHSVLIWQNVSDKERRYFKYNCLNFLRSYAVNNISIAWMFIKSIDDHEILKNILFSVNSWSNPISYEVFEKCENSYLTDSFGYYHVLDNIAKSNPDFVLNKLEKLSVSDYDGRKRKREYKEGKLLERLVRSSPDKLFPILFERIRADIERPITDGDIIVHDIDFRSIDLDDDNLEGDGYLYRLLAISLKHSAESKSPAFITFIDRYPKSAYESILRLLIFALTGNEREYRNKVFDIFNHIIQCNNQYFNSNLNYEIRVLVGNTIPYFSKKQTNAVIDVIQHLAIKDEIWYHTDNTDQKRKFYSHWGSEKFKWLLRFPDNVIADRPNLRSQFLELSRRYKGYEEARPHRVMVRGVYSPIPEKAFQHMSKENWLRSFRKYNGERNQTGRDWFKGGLSELADAFQRTVTEKPDLEMLAIIKASIVDPHIDIRYPIYGLRAWTKANKNLTLTIPLFKELMYREHERFIRDIVDIASNLIGEEKDDPEVVDFLVEKALDFSESYHRLKLDDDDGTSIRKLVTIGVNTPFGAAARALVHVQDINLKDSVFGTFEQVFRKGPREARAVALFEYAFLMNLDKDRAFHIFAGCVNFESDIDVLASAIWSLSYLGNYDFKALTPTYEKLVTASGLGRDDSESLFNILYGAYLMGRADAEQLLFRLLDNNEDSRTGAVNTVIKHYYEFSDSQSKNNLLLDYILERTSEQNYERLSWSFLHADHLRIDDIYPFLRKYVVSDYFKVSDYFLDYLTLCSGQSPFTAIELFELAMQHEGIEDDERFRGHSDNAGIRFIVGAFNALNGKDERSRSTRIRLLTLFDRILTDYRYKANAEKVLEKLL